MLERTADIHDYEVSNLINKLLLFLGRRAVEQQLTKYHASLRTSGPIFGAHYLKNRHPWWTAFDEYFALHRAGKSLKKNLSHNIKRLAGDAKKISVLQKLMPPSVKHKYTRDLVDENRANDYLFEIYIAWHFYLMNYEIVWLDDVSSRHAEYLVKTQDSQFNVECKRISLDASRKIRRRDFYRLADRIISSMGKRYQHGSINITLNDRLHSSDRYLNELSSQVFKVIEQGHSEGDFKFPYGYVSLKLKRNSNEIVDFLAIQERVMRYKPAHSHVAVFAQSFNEKPVNPIELILTSEKADNVLSGIKDKIYKAATLQLREDRPGLLVCFLEGIYDLSTLASDSGLQFMTGKVLSQNELSHVAAISYCSESLSKKYGNIENIYNQGLIFRNQQCKFNEASSIQFLSALE